MHMPRNRPLVAVIPDRRLIEEQHHFHMVGEKYLRALVVGADVFPVMLPALSRGPRNASSTTDRRHASGSSALSAQARKESHSAACPLPDEEE